MAPHLTMEQRRMARRLRGEGLSLREVARQVSCSHEGVRVVLAGKAIRPAKPDAWEPAGGRLSLAEREEISLGLQRGDSFTAIASRLGRVTSTVSREVASNGGRGGYRAWRAHQRARERARRPKGPFAFKWGGLAGGMPPASEDCQEPAGWIPPLTREDGLRRGRWSLIVAPPPHLLLCASPHSNAKSRQRCPSSPAPSS